MAKEEIKSLIISNFDGNLVKELFGDINSGSCPVSLRNFGKNPFWSKYSQAIEFLPQPVSIGGSDVTQPLMQMRTSTFPTAGVTYSPYTYCQGMNGTILTATGSSPSTPAPDVDDITIFSNNPTATTANYSGGMLLSSVSGVKRLYIGTDTGFAYTNNASADACFNEAQATWTSATTTTSGCPKPLVEFLGKIYIGNGANLSESTDGLTITTAQKLSPSIPTGYVFRDLAVSADGRYLIGIASEGTLSKTYDTSTGNIYQVILPNSVIVYWNGSDSGLTAMKILKGLNLSCLVVTNTYMVIIGSDDEGLGIYDLEGNRLAQIFDDSSSGSVYPPLGGQAYPVEKKIFFLAQVGKNVGLYCFNKENNSIYCLYSETLTAETIRGAVSVPSTHANAYDGSEISRQRIFFSFSKLPIATQANNFLYRLHTQNASESAQLGTYSTQVQRFAKKIKVGEVRVFCEPTAENNAFTMYLINSSATAIANSEMNYVYAAGNNEGQGQGSLDLIRFSPEINATHALGLQFMNKGTAQITINKVEIDYVFVERPPSNQ